MHIRLWHAPAQRLRDLTAAAGLPKGILDDVQAVLIIGIPTHAIQVARGENEPIFTIKEQAGNLKLLVERAGGDAIYSSAHICKAYELEPSLLVDARRKLSALVASGTGGWEQQAALERKISEFQMMDVLPQTKEPGNPCESEYVITREQQYRQQKDLVDGLVKKLAERNQELEELRQKHTELVERTASE